MFTTTLHYITNAATIASYHKKEKGRHYFKMQYKSPFIHSEV